MTDFSKHMPSVIRHLGQDVTYTPLAGAPKIIRGLYYEDLRMSEGFATGIETKRLVIAVITADVVGCKHGDQFAVGAGSYVVTSIDPETSGITPMVLRKA